MYIVDYHTHPYGHGEKDINFSVFKKYIKQALKKDIKELGFSDHDIYYQKIDWGELIKLKRKSKIKIRLGIEFDYVPGKEQSIEEVINKIPFDYCIGSVHKIGDWEFDHPAYKEEYHKRDIDLMYQKYYEIVKKAVKSGLFDIIGHLDLIKVFDYRPENLDILQLVNPVLKLIKKYNLVIEINSNGLNKPVKEMYPGKAILKKAQNMSIPVTTGSDAHTYKRVGAGLTQAVAILNKVGYKYIATFNNRQLKKIEI